jgi:hypothetical protein
MLLTTAAAIVASAGSSHDAIPCGFDAEGTVHLMRLLSDLYSNAHAAVLREYSVNAYDSHREAGNPGPVEVTLPTDLNPTLVIADHGTGLSKDEVTSVYARYGASTKRGTNDQVGAFGLGTKSAFTLGQQFIVTAVKDGWRTVAAFGVSVSGAGTVTILGHDQTGEANGVTVSISVDDPGAVQRAAGPVFFTWQPGTVLVNGQRPRSVWDAPLEVAGGIYLADSPDEDAGTWGDAGLIVVMGNIGYPVSPGLRDKLCHRMHPHDGPVRTLLYAQRPGQRVFAYVDIGDVDIAPSREEMRDTPRTLDRLARIAGEYRRGVPATVQREVGSAATLTAAARTAAALSRRPHLAHAVRGRAGLSWRGQPIAYDLRVPYPASAFAPVQGRCAHERESFRLRLDDSALAATLVVTGVPEHKLESALRAARAFLAARSDCRRVVFAPPGAQPTGWFAFGQPDTFPAMPFTEYLAEARRRSAAPPVAGRPVQAIRYAAIAGTDSGVRELTAEEIGGLGLPVVVAGSRDDQLHTIGMRFQAFARAVRDGVVVVQLSSGRTQAALQRRLGGGVPVISLGERAGAVAADVAATLTVQDRELERARACTAGVSREATRELSALRSRITGPVAAVVLDRLHRAEHLTAAETARLDMIAGSRERQPGLFPPAVQREGLFDLFPLLGCVNYNRPDQTKRDHIVAYLNAVTG